MLYASVKLMVGGLSAGVGFLYGSRVAVGFSREPRRPIRLAPGLIRVSTLPEKEREEL